MTTEPLLHLKDIQGIVVPGFLKQHQALLCFRLPIDPEQFRRLVGELLVMLDGGCFASGQTALADREAHRKSRHRESRQLVSPPLVAIAFTAPGLDMLSNQLAATVPSTAFQAGMAKRAGLFGDADPADWVVGKTNDIPHLMLVVAGDEKQAVRDLARRLQDTLVCGHTPILAAEPQFGDVLEGGLRGREHFGFVDGVSQPGIRGRASNCPTDFITRRHLPTNDPEHAYFGYPGQHLVWPGEFVLGYPASSPDPLIPGPPREVPTWMHNGSFLVYQRLRQDVAAFECTMIDEATRLRQQPGFANISAEKLAAMLVGRWPSGAPLSRSPERDDPELGADAMRNNDFRFDDNTPERPWLTGEPSALPTARADIIGQVCPVASHIRKVNVRDQASDMGGASATQTRRLLRIGVPYGNPFPPVGPDWPRSDRGLLFLSIQASIDDQFEFLQARWINSHARPRGPGGNDMVVGQNSATPDGERRCVVFGENLASAEVVAKQSFVTMTGGAYFFVPALSSLRALLLQALNPEKPA